MIFYNISEIGIYLVVDIEAFEKMLLKNRGKMCGIKIGR